MRQRGFTLIEMLIALGIFALIGVASYRLLQSTAAASEQGMQRSEQLDAEISAVQLLYSDLTQILPGSLRLDVSGLAVIRNGASYGLPGRADLLEVQLLPEGEVMYRQLLAKSEQKELPLRQALLLPDASFRVQDDQGRAHPLWPLPEGDAANAIAVVVRWQSSLGERERVFSLR